MSARLASANADSCSSSVATRATSGFTCTAPDASSSIAGTKGPQRDPTSVTSSTTIGHDSIGASPWKVDFITTVPRGRTISSARVSPCGRPVTSTTMSNRRAARNRLAGRRGGEPELARDGELGFVPPEHGHVGAGAADDLRDEQSHPAVAEDGDAAAGSHRHLLEDAARRRHRLDEHRRRIVEAVRHFVKVDGRERDELGERAAMVADAHHRAVGAVFLDAGRAPFAAAAADVDLADDPLADPRGIRRGRRLHDADELMAGDAGEAGVALEDLQVGAADARHADADQALALVTRLRHVLARDRASGMNDERFHCRCSTKYRAIS